MAIDKSTWNKKIKVSQSTINDIKKLGMTKALKLAQTNSKAEQAGLVAEYQEATRRLYGDRRFNTATKAKAPVSKSPDAARAGVTKPTVKPTVKPVVKPKAKTGSSMADKAKVVGGTAAAIGLLALGKGKGGSAAAKLSPAVGKFAKSGVGKALFGTGEKISTKAFSTAGRVTAKAGKPVSQTQFDAMKAAAKAKGIKLPTAAKATATKPKPGAAKATATKPAPKLTKTAAFAASGSSNQKTTTKTKTKTKIK